MNPSLAQKLKASVTYGYGNMIVDTAKWLLIGLVAAALITTFVPQSFFLRWGDGLMAMIVMVIVGLPMYICATASTPVAASLLFAGASTETASTPSEMAEPSMTLSPFMGTSFAPDGDRT